MQELTGPPPTVLIVEDVHWADDATLDVLSYLARRISTLAAVLVLTFRDEEGVRSTRWRGCSANSAGPRCTGSP